MKRRASIPILLACLLTASCWPWWSSDGDGGYCTCEYGETECSGYSLLGTCDDGCSFTYHDCDRVCLGAGYVRSAGCGYDGWSGDACLCTDDTACDCSGGDTECWDAYSLLSCDDGCFWSAWDCDALCRASGWDSSTGCGFDFSTGGDACFCEDTPDCACTYGEVECSGLSSISSCDDGCSWSVHDCDALCVGAGYEYSTGCGYDPEAGEDTCFCESSTACDCTYGEVECWDLDSIASCDDGCYFYVYDCDALCVEAGYSTSTGCGYDPEAGEDTCFCVS